MLFRLSRKAEDDLVDLYTEGVRQFGPAQADRYFQRLEMAFRFLSENPLAGRLRTELSPPMRVHPFGVHIILYTSDDTGVLIVRVRHGREDWLPD